MKNSIRTGLLSSVFATSAVALSLTLAAPAMAQVTTSSMRGTVQTATGVPATDAQVTIRHTPTGTVTDAVTDSRGIFQARNLRVGGPYLVTINANGFDAVEAKDIFLGLDSTYPLNVTVGGSVSDEIIVTGTVVSQQYMDTGLSSSFNLEALDKIASIDRDIADIAELDPFANINPQSGGAKELSIAGANNRFNSLTIDGVALNDRFGLNANGYPTQRSPIPFDAIESLSVETAPYDMEFNGFTGGTINAVTKSGENEFHGSASYFYTDDSFAGTKTRDRKIDQSFEEKSYAFTLGGPIVKDKLFFFAAYEKYEEAAALRDGPVGSNASNIQDITQNEITEIAGIVQDQWGFDAGGFVVDPVAEEKYLASIDWNISNDHRAKFTYLHNEGSAIREQDGNSFLGDRGVDELGFSSSWYNRSETVDSYIGHIFSDWSSNFSTELKLAYTDQTTGQNSLNGAEFPLFTVRISEAERGVDANGDGDMDDNIANISLGPDTFRHGNSLDQQFFQVKAKAEYSHADHTFKLGYEREDVDVDNLFAPNSEGQYFFESIENLRNREASALIYENAITNDENDRRALWGYTLNSLYLQDVWDIRDDLTVQYGMRFDHYSSTGTIRKNDNFLGRYGYSNANDIDSKWLWMPRFSFNWDATDKMRVRGGLGRFSGGSPSVWLSNAYSNDGVTNDDVFARDVIVPNTPDATTGNYIPADVLATLANTTPDGSVAAILPNFKIPSTMKANIGVAYEADMPVLGDGWLLTADVLYNDYENAPYWFDQSCETSGTAPDGRPTYSCPANGDPEAIVTGSVDLGDSLLVAVSASKEWETEFGDIDLFTSYTHADVNDIGQGTSSTATSNYSDTPRFDYQVPTVGTSNFQTEHSFKIRLAWEKELVDDYATKVSLFGTRRSGQPYSYTFATDGRNDPFGIRENRADDAGSLLYVPSGPSDPLFSSASFGGDAGDQAAFFDYINSSELAEYAGQIAPRNAFNSRWSSLFDLRFEQELPGLKKGHKTSLFLDVENVGNLIDSDWGVVERVRYEYEQQTAVGSIDNGQYIYDDLDTSLSTEVLNNSLWRAQVGIRYKFQTELNKRIQGGHQPSFFIARKY